MSNKRLITVGHSPDPDDAFMFYALAHDKLDTGDLLFRHQLEDIETLNRRALRGELEVTAISIHAYALLLDNYALLPSGCSMGDRYGPLVVARRPLVPADLKTARIAVPGTMTTAFLTLRLLVAESFAYEVVPFDQILDGVSQGRYDAGLIIHEGQLTFQNLGLHAVVDLGVWWQERTGLPLPLGGNVVRRDLGYPLMRKSAGSLNKASATPSIIAMMLWRTPSGMPETWTRSWRIVSWACMSMTGRWITARAAGKRSAACSTKATAPDSFLRRWRLNLWTEMLFTFRARYGAGAKRKHPCRVTSSPKHPTIPGTVRAPATA